MFHNSRPSPIFRQGSLIRSKEGPRYLALIPPIESSCSSPNKDLISSTSIMITENSTNAAIWPTSMPSSDVKTLVERFFTLVDTNSDDVGQKLAEEVFTPDAVFITANTTFQGQAGETMITVILGRFVRSLTFKFRNIAISERGLVHCQKTTSYNLEELCERRARHGYHFCRKLEDGSTGWNKDKSRVCGPDEN